MRYEAPNSVQSAIDILGANPDNTYILAGGTDLLVKMRADMIEPDLIVDIKRIEALKDIEPEDGGWRIGAAVSGAQMSEHEGLCKDWPGVVEGMNLIGSTQVQGRATLAGNLCNASPAADSVPAMIAAGAKVAIAGPKGTREIPVEQVTTAPGKTSLAADEFITSVLLPAKPANSGDAYLRFIPRTEMDIAVVGCGISIELESDGTCKTARVSLGAVGPTALVVAEAAACLIGSRVTETDLDKLKTICSDAASPIDDKRGTIEFRKHVAGVLAKRAALIAVARCAETGKA